jgi:DNA-binding XRE family transcriptional regulator
MLRAKSQMSQGQLAEAVGVVRETISSYERGLGKPDLKTVISLSEVLKVGLEQMLFTDLRAGDRSHINEPTVGYGSRLMKRVVAVLEVPRYVDDKIALFQQCDQIEEFNFPANPNCPDLGFLLDDGRMLPLLAPGDRIFCQNEILKTVAEGALVFARLKRGQPFAARIFRQGTDIEFRFESPAEPRIIVPPGDVADLFRIVHRLSQTI